VHPILSSPKRIFFYLILWIPVGGQLYFWLTVESGLDRQTAVGPVALLIVIYAFACLSAFYSCKATPLETSGLPRIAFTHLLAAGIVSFSWLSLFTTIGWLVTPHPVFFEIGRHLHKMALWQIGILLYLLSVALHYLLIALENSRTAEQKAMQAAMLARDAELRALKAQINPHFLFNSLHSISALTSIDGKRARKMCVSLAEFLRLTLGLGEKNQLSLGDELALIHSYLAVEQIRFGERLHIEEQIDEATLGCMIPPLLLQPLVENAVVHGVTTMTEGGFLRICATAVENGAFAEITIENNFDPETPARRRNGVGLPNVRQRLLARFGPRAEMKLERSEEIYTAWLRIPIETEAQEDKQA